MAPPPKYIIERRLIKKFIKQYIPKHPLLPPSYFSAVFDCWRKYGTGSHKCKQEEMQYDFAQEESLNYRGKMEKLGLTELVMKELRKPIYPFNVKGRHKKNNYERIMKFF